MLVPAIVSLKRRARERARLPFLFLYLCISWIHCNERGRRRRKSKSKSHRYWQLIVFEQGKGMGGKAGGLQLFFVFCFFEEIVRKTNRGLGILRKSFIDAFFPAFDSTVFVCVCICVGSSTRPFHFCLTALSILWPISYSCKLHSSSFGRILETKLGLINWESKPALKLIGIPITGALLEE